MNTFPGVGHTLSSSTAYPFMLKVSEILSSLIPHSGERGRNFGDSSKAIIHLFFIINPEKRGVGHEVKKSAGCSDTDFKSINRTSKINFFSIFQNTIFDD